jgi:hypothetical protein
MTQIASGVTSLDPAAAVVSTVTGSEVAKLKVASGDYNRMIDEKLRRSSRPAASDVGTCARIRHH